MNDEKEGYGALVTSQGSVFCGEWKCGQFISGHCNTNSYVGEWSNNQRNGHGVFKMTNGVEYDGSWLDDRKHG